MSASYLVVSDANSIVKAIKQFYIDNQLELQRTVMSMSDGTAVMLGKNNGTAAILRQGIAHLSEQHCVAHREDLGTDDARKHVSLMKDIETLLRMVYTMFRRSSVKETKFEELAKVAECDSVAFRLLNEVRRLSRIWKNLENSRNFCFTLWPTWFSLFFLSYLLFLPVTFLYL